MGEAVAAQAWRVVGAVVEVAQVRGVGPRVVHGGEVEGPRAPEVVARVGRDFVGTGERESCRECHAGMLRRRLAVCPGGTALCAGSRFRV